MHDLTAEMIHLNQSHLPANCVFSVTRVGAPGDDGAGDDERTGGRVVVSFPMDKCGGTYEMASCRSSFLIDFLPPPSTPSPLLPRGHASLERGGGWTKTDHRRLKLKAPMNPRK